jgi:hypothetical protein
MAQVPDVEHLRNAAETRQLFGEIVGRVTADASVNDEAVVMSVFRTVDDAVDWNVIWRHVAYWDRIA